MYIKIYIAYLISRKEKSKGHQWQHNCVCTNWCPCCPCKIMRVSSDGENDDKVTVTQRCLEMPQTSILRWLRCVSVEFVLQCYRHRLKLLSRLIYIYRVTVVTVKYKIKVGTSRNELVERADFLLSSNEYTIESWRQWRQKRGAFSFCCWPCEKRRNSVKTGVPISWNNGVIFLTTLSALYAIYATHSHIG